MHSYALGYFTTVYTFECPKPINKGGVVWITLQRLQESNSCGHCNSTSLKECFLMNNIIV